MNRAKGLGRNRRLRQTPEDNVCLGGRWSSVEFRRKISAGSKRIEPARCGYSGQLAPVIIGVTMMIAIMTMPSVPVVRPVVRSIIRSVIRVRVVPVRVISVIARTEPDTEENLSIRTRGPCNHQTPGHDCNQQKFPHYLPPTDLTGKSAESFPFIRRSEHLDNR